MRTPSQGEALAYLTFPLGTASGEKNYRLEPDSSIIRFMPTLNKRVFIGIGSNLGDREEYLEQVFQAVRTHPHFSNIALSSVCETKPVKAQGADYLNAVAAFDTQWDALNVYRWMMALEMNAGRERKTLNAPRTLDLDLLFYGGESVHTAQLDVPHPRLHERAFVLIPLSEIAPNWIHPVYKKSVLEMRNALSFNELLEVKRLEEKVSRHESR